MLYEKIMAIYPQLTQQDFMTTIRLQNDSDGRGDYIASWTHELPQPTEKDLQQTQITALNAKVGI